MDGHWQLLMHIYNVCLACRWYAMSSNADADRERTMRRDTVPHVLLGPRSMAAVPAEFGGRCESGFVCGPYRAGSREDQGSADPTVSGVRARNETAVVLAEIPRHLFQQSSSPINESIHLGIIDYTPRARKRCHFCLCCLVFVRLLTEAIFSKNCPRLRRFKSDRDEIWQDCFSSTWINYSLIQIRCW